MAENESVATGATGEKVGVSTTSNTEDKVLDDGTHVIKTTQTLKQVHEHGATTVKSTNTKRIGVIETEERVIDLPETPMEYFYLCCPCFKKKKVDEEGEAEGDEDEGNGDEEGKSKWKPVPAEDAK